MTEEIYNDEGIECPSCGYVEEEGEITHDLEIETHRCGRCGKKMDVNAEISWMWTSSVRDVESIEKEIENEKGNMERNLGHEDEEINKFFRGKYQYRIDQLVKEIVTLIKEV